MVLQLSLLPESPILCCLTQQQRQDTTVLSSRQGEGEVLLEGLLDRRRFVLWSIAGPQQL